jgi:hypothetical protein
MPAAAWVTLVISALIIGLTAVALFRVILHLKHVRETLAAVDGGVRVIAQRTSPVPVVIPSVNANLKPVRDFCESV